MAEPTTSPGTDHPVTTSTVRSGSRVDLHVVEHGDRAAPTVVLVHGYPDTSVVWDRVVPLLADACHVVTYDVRGAGRSSRPSRVRDHAFPHLMADLRAVLDTVSPGEPAHLVGHDWGAIQGWEAACDPDTAPRLASFTAVSAPSFDLAGRRVRTGLAPHGARVALEQVARSWYIAAFQVPGLPALAWRRGLGRRWGDRRRRLEADPNLPDPAPTITEDGVAGVRLYRANVGRLFAPVRTEVLVPTRVVTGGRDPFVSPTVFAGLGPDIDVEVVAGARHWLPLTHPETVAQQASRAMG